jgi:UDP-N-acetyl-D-galactosamine dehydrogenase
MGMFVANKVIKLMIQKGLSIKGSRVLILGFTFKENCPDIRNTRVIDIYNELDQFGLKVEVADPWASKGEVMDEYGINIFEAPQGVYDAVILAVSHDRFRDLDIKALGANNELVIYDTKAYLARGIADGRL